MDWDGANGTDGASVGDDKIDYVIMQFSDALGSNAPTTAFTPSKNIDTTFGSYNPNNKVKGNYQDKNVFDITYGTSKSTRPYLSFNAGGNAIVLQNGDSRGAFVADMGISSQAREMNVVFNGNMMADSKSYSLQGDFIARSGANSTLNVTFTHSMKGNIKTINVIGNDYYQTNENGDALTFDQKQTVRTFTFESGAKLEGNINGGSVDSSNITEYKDKQWFGNFVDQFIFKDSNVELQNISYNSGSTNIVIQGNGSIKNLSTGYGGYGMGPKSKDLRGLTGKIYVSFEKNDNGTNTINQINGGGGLIDVIFGATRSNNPITAQGTAISTITKGIIARDGSINVTFATNGDSTIEKISDSASGNFSANDAFRFNGGGASATANISFLGSGTNKVNGNVVSLGAYRGVSKTLNLSFAGGTSSIEGSVIAYDFANNNVSFANGGNITGDVCAKWTGYGSEATNNISFNGNNNAKIGGKILINSGTNAITFNGTGTNSIGKGVATIGGGSNTITFNGANNTIGGTITSEGGDGGANAILTKSGGANIFVLNGDSANLTIENKIHHRWDAKKTEFKVTGNNSTLNLNNDINIDGSGGEGLKITFAGSSGTLKIGTTDSNGSFTAKTLYTGDYRAYNANTNITFANSGTIQGNITTRHSSSASIAFGTQSSVDTLTNTITGNIITSNGTISINFGNKNTPRTGTNTITGKVSTESGTTSITFYGANNTITGSGNTVYSGGGTNRITFNGSNNTITGNVFTDHNGSTIIQVNQGDLNITGGVTAQKWGGRSSNRIIVDNGNLTVRGEIRANNDSGTNNNTIRANNITFGLMNAQTGFNDVTATSDINGGKIVVANSASTNISAENITFKATSNGDVITTNGSSRLNITAKNLTITRYNAGSAMWSNNSSQTNITIKDGGSLSTYQNNGTSSIADIALDKNSVFRTTFEGNATVKVNFTTANNSSSNQNIMNFGNENSSGKHTVTFNGSLTNSSNVNIANIFNFNANDFTFAFKNSGNTYQNLTIGNNRKNAINFNANSGAFDLGTNTLNVTGTLGISLTQANSTNTIKANSITSSRATTIAFNADNTTLNLVNGSSKGTLNVTGGTTAINIAEGMNGILNGNIATSSGATNITFQGVQSSSLTLQGSSSVVSNITAIATPVENRTTPISTLIIDGSANMNSTSTARVTNGENLNVYFKGADNAKTFAITSGENSLNKILLDSNSTHNTLDTSGSVKLQIITALNIGVDGQNQDLTIKLTDAELATAGITTTNGTSTILVGDQTSGGATISGSNIDVSTLKMDTASTSTSITFKNAESVFGKLDSVINNSQNYDLILGEGSSLVKFSDTENIATLSNVTFEGVDQILEFGGGTTTLNEIITSDNGKSTLKLSSGTTFETANDTNVSASAITNGGASGLHILFTGGTDDQIHRSTLTLTGTSNELASVTSEAKNAFIKLDGTSGNAGVTIEDRITITDGNSLIFSLTSGASSSATATAQDGISVERGGTFGVSIGGGDGAKAINVGTGNNGAVDFQAGSILLVDFLENASGVVTLGGNADQEIEIGKKDGIKSKSIVNFWGNNGNAQLAGGLNINGGDNTVNFLGDATLSGIKFTSGTNTINVRDNGKSTGVTATINLADNSSGQNLGNMTNTINLENNAKLIINGSDSTLVASDSAKPSTLNFIGNNATFQGGLKVTDGSAIINVGYDNSNNSLQGVAIAEEVSGTITGQVTNVDLAFNSKKSQLTLQGATNTFKSLTSNATDGLLYLDAKTSNVSAQIQGDITIGEGTSLTFGLISGNLPSSNNQAGGGSTQGGVSTQAEASVTGGEATLTTSGNIVVKGSGTLGIAIGGDGTNTRSVTLSEGKNITFDPYSKLRVDFLEGSRGQATLGSADNKFKIEANRESEINFYANSNATLAGGGLSLQGGTNTVNFYGDATLGQIELKSGKNYINVKDGVTATVQDTASNPASDSNINNVSNTINLGEDSTLKLNANTADNGDGSILSALKNELNFNGDSSTLEGGFGATGDGTASINVGGTNSKITGNVTKSSITFTTSNADLTLQGASNTITTLTGYTPAVASYVRNGRVISTSSQNTLTLDATNGDASVTIAQAITGNSVALKFGDNGNKKTFTLSEGGNTLSGVLFGNTSTNNTLAFTKGANVITENMTIASGNDLTIALGDDTTDSTQNNAISLDFAGGLSGDGSTNGTAKISVKGNNNVYGILSGGEIDAKSLEFGATTSATLVVKNSSATFGTLTATQASTLTLDGSDNSVAMTINKLITGETDSNPNANLTVAFSGGNNENTLQINSGKDEATKIIALSGITVASGSTHNTLDLSSLTKATISNEVEITGSEDSNKSLTINLKDTELEFAGGLSTQNATTTINVSKTTTGAILSGGDVVVTNLNMSGAGALQTAFKNSSTTIDNLSASGSTSNKIILDGNSSASGVTTTLNTITNGQNLDVELKGDSSKIATLNLNGGTLKSISVSNGTEEQNILSLQSGTTTLVNQINTASVATGKGLSINFQGNSELALTGGIDNTSAGTINLAAKTANTQGIISGAEIKATNAILDNGATLAIRNTSATLDNASGNGVLSIDAINNAVTAKINNNVNNGSNLTLNFNGRGSNKQASLTLGNGGSFKTLTISSGSTGNTLALGANTTSFSDKVELGKGVGITFDLSNNTTLALNGGLSGGTTTLAVSSNGGANSATLSGKATGDEIANIALTKVNLSGSNASTLTLKAQSITINALSATATTSNTLKLDGTDNAVNAVIQQNLSGNNLDIQFGGTDTTRGAILTLNGSNNTIKSLSVVDSSTNNTLVVTQGTTRISDATTINQGELNIDLNGAIFSIANSFDTTSNGTTNINFLQGTSSITGNGLKVSGGTLNLNVSSNATARIDLLEKSNGGNANLSFNGDNGLLYFIPTTDKATLDLTSISNQGSGNIVDIASNYKPDLGYYIDGSDESGNGGRKSFRVLKIDNGENTAITGQSLGFKLFVDKFQSGSDSIGGIAITDGTNTYGYAYSDRIVVNGKSDTSSTHILYIVPKIDELNRIAYNGGGTEVENNVAVATIKKGSGITLGTEKILNGFEVIQAELIPVDTDENGKVINKGTGDYTTYFLGKVTSVGTSIETQEVASTALSINYDLYMANLNSLNKRMGELRDNNHNQGVWARVFGGAQSSSFGIGSDTEYVTVQAGYDYDFDFSNAKNYLGVAFSYATSTSKSLSATQSIVNANASSNNMVGIDNINSNAYEVAVYNSYVSDSGWYNDTIAKFSYINSTFSLTNSANQSSTTNMAFTLSDEVGYRYKFAENEKGNWYIDPQLELSFGYLNQSDFNSMIASVSSSGFSNLNAFQDAVMTLRTRIGASLGKKFNTDKGFASLYMGAFYEYDYVAGGDSDIGVESGATNTLSPLSSSGRAVLNVGSNIELTKGARLYIDVEKSFGDKFRTHMQFNVGTRYSF